MYYNLYYMMNDFEAFYICSRNQNETGCGSFLCAHRLYKVLTIQTKKDMEIKIQISDAVYAQLLNGSTRIKGSIGLVNSKEGNFNAYLKRPVEKLTQYLKLPHGRVSVSETDIRLAIHMKRQAYDRHSGIMEDEALMACSYVDLMDDIYNC